MVSGLVTSPCDQLRIFSGEATLILMESKSATWFPRSNGLERYKVSSCGIHDCRFRLRKQRPVTSSQLPVKSFAQNPWSKGVSIEIKIFFSSGCHSGNWQPETGNCLIRRYRCRLLGLEVDQLNVETQCLQFADKHVERLRYARLDRRFALHDGLVDLGAAIHVVGLRRQQLLQDVSRAVSFQSPNFHLSEALSAKLRLAAQRLLGDKRVRSDGARVDLVVDQVRELQHVDVAHRHRLFELVAGHAVEEFRLA